MEQRVVLFEVKCVKMDFKILIFSLLKSIAKNNYTRNTSTHLSLC